MPRARLASLAVAGGLLFAIGCQTSSFDILHPMRSRRDSAAMGCPTGCDCGDSVGFSAAPCCPTPGCATGCGNGFGNGFGVPLISNAHPPIMEGPSLFPPSPTPIFPGTTMPPVTMPRPAPLPSVVTVPQATITPSPPH